MFRYRAPCTSPLLTLSLVGCDGGSHRSSNVDKIEADERATGIERVSPRAREVGACGQCLQPVITPLPPEPVSNRITGVSEYLPRDMDDEGVCLPRGRQRLW